MTDFLFTDTHFGVRNHSLVWYKAQEEFIYKQFIPSIKQSGDVRIIHLGDVFDSRSGVNLFIANGVRKIFQALAELDNVKEIIVVAGNHDFYSPANDKCCSIEILLNNIPKTKLVIREIYETDTEAFVPWYEAERLGLKGLPNKIIYTHTDITNYDFSKPVYSGHIHYPVIKGNSYNLGSCYPLTFADSNAERCFYIKDETGLHRQPNKYSINFWRYYDEEVLQDINAAQGDYIELYIKQGLLSRQDYQDRIAELKATYGNLWIIPQYEQIEIQQIDIQRDMNSIIKDLIPDEIKDKFDILEQQINNIH